GLWRIQEQELERRKLSKLYLAPQCLGVLEPTLTMEANGLVVHAGRLRELTERYGREMRELERRCVNLSGGKLSKLPSGISNELKEVFALLGLESPKLT